MVSLPEMVNVYLRCSEIAKQSLMDMCSHVSYLHVCCLILGTAANDGLLTDIPNDMLFNTGMCDFYLSV